MDTKKAVWRFAAASAFCLLIFLVYDRFSHNVRSNYMTFLFAWPLILGVIPNLLLTGIKKWHRPGFLAENLYVSGVAAVTVSSLLRGIFEIAGNSSIYQVILMGIGICFLIAGVISYLLKK